MRYNSYLNNKGSNSQIAETFMNSNTR